MAEAEGRREKDLDLVEEFESVRAVTSDGRSVRIPKSKIGGNLETATETVLGGIKAAEKTEKETVEAKIDPVTGKLFVPKGGSAPDDEDITLAEIGGEEKLQFKDKLYNSSTYSGLGRKYLRKNMVDGVNVLQQSFFNNDDGTERKNTRYIIQYDYDLNGATITIPDGCVLQFDGGVFKNGTLVLNGTKIESVGVCFKDIHFVTNKYYNEFNSSWFDDFQDAVDAAIEAKTSLCVDKKVTVSKSVALKGNFITIHGSSIRSSIECTNKNVPVFDIDKGSTINYLKITDLKINGGSVGINRDYADGDSWDTMSEGNANGGSLQVVDFIGLSFEDQKYSAISIKGYGLGCSLFRDLTILSGDKSQYPAIDIEVFWYNRNHITDCRINGYYSGGVKIKANQFMQNEIENLWLEYIYFQKTGVYALSFEGSYLYDFVLSKCYIERIIELDQTSGKAIFINGMSPARNITIKELSISYNLVNYTWITLKGTIVGISVYSNGAFNGSAKPIIDASGADVYDLVLFGNARQFSLTNIKDDRYIELGTGLKSTILGLENNIKNSSVRDYISYGSVTNYHFIKEIAAPTEQGVYLLNFIINPASLRLTYSATYIVYVSGSLLMLSLTKLAEHNNTAGGGDVEISNVVCGANGSNIKIDAELPKWSTSSQCVIQSKFTSMLKSGDI